MEVTFHIPDDLAARLGAEGDLLRRGLEALALEERKSGRIGRADLRRVLGLTTRYEFDGFLEAHDVWADYTLEDFQREREISSGSGSEQR